MSQEKLRERLLNLIEEEGVSQKHIAYRTNINEGLLSRFKNHRDNSDLDLIDRESLDEFLTSKGY